MNSNKVRRHFALILIFFPYYGKTPEKKSGVSFEKICFAQFGKYYTSLIALKVYYYDNFVNYRNWNLIEAFQSLHINMTD